MSFFVHPSLSPVFSAVVVTPPPSPFASITNMTVTGTTKQSPKTTPKQPNPKQVVAGDKVSLSARPPEASAEHAAAVPSQREAEHENSAPPQGALGRRTDTCDRWQWYLLLPQCRFFSQTAFVSMSVCVVIAMAQTPRTRRQP